MEYVKVTKDNINDAIKVQKEIFFDGFCERDLTNYVNGIIADVFLECEFWLAKFNNKYIGLCGVYSYKEYPTDMWLGWSGVLPKERQKGYATQMLKHCYDTAKTKGYLTFRLYVTDSNDIAVRIYNNFKMDKEIYNNPQDKYKKSGKNTLVFSKSLKLGSPKPWNNRNLYISEHLERNEV